VRATHGPRIRRHFGRSLIVELKFGPLKDEHIGQIMNLAIVGGAPVVRTPFRPTSTPTSTSPAGPGRAPALLALVKWQWLEQARAEFKGGKPEIYFVADSQIGMAMKLLIQIVYFKAKGETNVVAKAKLTGVTTVNPSMKRLRGNENLTGRFYYGFRDLELLAEGIPLSSLHYFTTRQPVPNAAPGACIVEELPA
jgi:hypothetical protein